MSLTQKIAAALVLATMGCASGPKWEAPQPEKLRPAKVAKPKAPKYVTINLETNYGWENNLVGGLVNGLAQADEQKHIQAALLLDTDQDGTVEFEDTNQSQGEMPYLSTQATSAKLARQIKVTQDQTERVKKLFEGNANYQAKVILALDSLNPNNEGFDKGKVDQLEAILKGAPMPVEPIKPVEKPTEPVKPVEQPKPVEPIKPVEKPIEPVKPTAPAEKYASVKILVEYDLINPTNAGNFETIAEGEKQKTPRKIMLAKAIDAEGKDDAKNGKVDLGEISTYNNQEGRRHRLTHRQANQSLEDSEEVLVAEKEKLRFKKFVANLNPYDRTRLIEEIIALREKGVERLDSPTISELEIKITGSKPRDLTPTPGSKPAPRDLTPTPGSKPTPRDLTPTEQKYVDEKLLVSYSLVDPFYARFFDNLSRQHIKGEADSFQETMLAFEVDGTGDKEDRGRVILTETQAYSTQKGYKMVSSKPKERPVNERNEPVIEHSEPVRLPENQLKKFRKLVAGKNAYDRTRIVMYIREHGNQIDNLSGIEALFK